MVPNCNHSADYAIRNLLNRACAQVVLEPMESRFLLSTSPHAELWDVPGTSPADVRSPVEVQSLASAPVIVQQTGDGLRGEYFNDMNLQQFVLTRNDSSINFDWGWRSPDRSIGRNTFSERWTGYIMPKYSETYTFTTRSDDGVRLWINNQLVIDQWNDHAPSEHSGQITLQAGKKYQIRMEHYENGGVAVAKLYWQSDSQSRQIVPKENLFTTDDSSAPTQPQLPTTPTTPTVPTEPTVPTVPTVPEPPAPPTVPTVPTTPPNPLPPPPPAPTAPSAPTGLAASALSTSGIKLTWVDRSNNESRFVIERSNDGKNYSQLTSLGANTTAYSDQSLAAGTRYYYRVMASNDVGNSGYSAANAATNAEVPTPPPVIPTPPPVTPPPPTIPTPPPSTGPIVYSGPITITKGGTYTGNWESTDAKRAAVQIETSEPVTIVNSNIRGRGDLIESTVDGANLTVLNTSGYALNPNVAGKSPGRFLEAELFDKVNVQNCYMEGTAGMYFYKGGAITVLYNSALNIDGRASDGHGGFSTDDGDSDLVQFVQLNDIHNQPVEIGWNKVINEPGKSRSEDVISIYASSGTASRPIAIHDNYIQGSYPSDPATQGFSGGGIMVGDGRDCGFISAYNNTVVSTSNYGIAISAGHDNQIYNNRIISAGILPDGRRIASQNVGLYIWDAGNDPSFGRNSARDNLIGWSDGKNGRNDSWTPDASSSNNNSMSGSITLATEANELKLWQTRVDSAGYIIGVKK